MEHTYKYIPPNEPPVHHYTLALTEQERLDLIQVLRVGRHQPQVLRVEQTANNMLKVLGVNP